MNQRHTKETQLKHTAKAEYLTLADNAWSLLFVITIHCLCQSFTHTNTHTLFIIIPFSHFQYLFLSQSISQSIIKTSVSQSATQTHTHTLSSPPITPASDFTKTDRTLIPVTRSVSQPHALIISHRKADSRPYYNQISRGESRTNRSKRTIEAHE